MIATLKNEREPEIYPGPAHLLKRVPHEIILLQDKAGTFS